MSTNISETKHMIYTKWWILDNILLSKAPCMKTMLMHATMLISQSPPYFDVMEYECLCKESHKVWLLPFNSELI